MQTLKNAWAWLRLMWATLHALTVDGLHGPHEFSEYITEDEWAN